MIKTEEEVEEKIKEIMVLFDGWTVISIVEALNDALVLIRINAKKAGIRLREIRLKEVNNESINSSRKN